MSYPLLVTLADLDGSLQAAEAQIELLAAGLEIREEHLVESLKAACHHATVLAGMIRSERPNAEWSDRRALDDIVLDLEAEAEARRDQQRRSRLLDLADELDAGRVKHRFEARTTILNALREDAVRELRAQAAMTEHAKELPGPAISEWLAWAFDLQDDNDAAVLEQLRTDFVAVEHFTGEMEESYWLPGRSVGSNAQPPSAPPSASAPHIPATNSDNVRPQGGTAVSYSDHAETDAWLHERPTIPLSSPDSRRPGEPSSLWQGDSSAETVALDVAETVPFTPPPLQHCMKCGRSFTGETHSCSAADLPSPAAQAVTETAHSAEVASQSAAVETPTPAAEISSHATAAIVETAASAPSTESPIEPAPEAAAEHVEEVPSTGSETRADKFLSGARGVVEKLAPYKKSPFAWGGAAGFVVLSILFFAIIYHVHARSGGKSSPTVEAATGNAATDSATSDATPDNPSAAAAPNAKLPANTANPKGTRRLAAEGPQDSILLSVENCGHGTPGNIECWGYVSNLGGNNSRVSLDRVDVVDGRGNSFSLDRNGQFAFPNGHSSDIAPGSHVKFTVKVPDKDSDARTLTLYMDLSNPRSLEYTFRDVPVAQ